MTMESRDEQDNTVELRPELVAVLDKRQREWGTNSRGEVVEMLLGWMKKKSELTSGTPIPRVLEGNHRDPPLQDILRKLAAKWQYEQNISGTDPLDCRSSAVDGCDCFSHQRAEGLREQLQRRSGTKCSVSTNFNRNKSSWTAGIAEILISEKIID